MIFVFRVLGICLEYHLELYFEVTAFSTSGLLIIVQVANCVTGCQSLSRLEHVVFKLYARAGGIISNRPR